MFRKRPPKKSGLDMTPEGKEGRKKRPPDVRSDPAEPPKWDGSRPKSWTRRYPPPQHRKGN